MAPDAVPDAPLPLGKEAIADEIRGRIADGRLALGARVSDKVLAAELAVSRTPVREAVILLASEGLIDIRPRSGTFVFLPRLDELRDLCELRGVYEGGALRLGIGRNRQELMSRLTTVVARAALAIETGELAACDRFDTQFHETLVEVSANRALIAAYQRIADKVRALRASLPRAPERLSFALAQHRRILDLAAAGETERAVCELESHVQNVHRLLATAHPA